MTSGGSFHLCEDRKPSWRKPSPEIVFLCHSATSLWLYILPEPGPQPCHIPMLPALQAGEGHPPRRATPTSDVIMAAHLSLWRDGGQVTLYQSHVKTEFLQLISKKQQQIESLGERSTQGAFLQTKTVAWVRCRVSTAIFCAGAVERHWPHPSAGGRSLPGKGSQWHPQGNQ